MYHSLKGLFYHNNLFQFGNTHFNYFLLVYSQSIVLVWLSPSQLAVSFERSPLTCSSIAYACDHCRDSPFAEHCHHCTWRWEFLIKTIWRVHSVLFSLLTYKVSLLSLPKKKKVFPRIVFINLNDHELSLDHSCLIMSWAMTKASGIYCLQIVAINFCAHFKP